MKVLLVHQEELVGGQTFCFSSSDNLQMDKILWVRGVGKESTAFFNIKLSEGEPLSIGCFYERPVPVVLSGASSALIENPGTSKLLVLLYRSLHPEEEKLYPFSVGV